MVVDNASVDDTTEVIRHHFSFVDLHCRTIDIGTVAAFNLGIERAIALNYQGIMMLQDDISCDAPTIRYIAQKAIDTPTIGVISIHPNLTKDPSITQKESGHQSKNPIFNWYIPRKTLLSVGLFSPLFFNRGARLDYLHRVQYIGLASMDCGSDRKMSIHHEKSPSLIHKSGDEYRAELFSYHLAEFIHPNYRPIKRFWRGVSLPFIRSLISRNQVYHDIAMELLKKKKDCRYQLILPNIDQQALQRSIHRKKWAPVLLLVYNRPKHTERILNYFWSQPEAEQTHLYILSDGAKGEEDRYAVAEVRRICRSIASDRVTLIEQDQNVGLANNVTQGIDRVLKEHESVIVLEDDLRLSPYFLRWMNDSLECYKDQQSVAHLHAGTFYASSRLRHNHALAFAGSWGWATWRDRWNELWKPDGTKLLAQFEENPTLKKHFDYNGYMKFTRMLRAQVQGKNNSWAIRWHASIVLNNRISINAYPPLASNEGFDGTGTHSSGDGRYRTGVAPFPLYARSADDLPDHEDQEARKILLRYYKLTNNKVMKGWYKLKELMKK